MLYSNQKIYLLRKPHWIASTFWSEKSILDYFKNPEQLLSILQKSDFNNYHSYCHIDGYTPETINNFIINQTTNFTKEQEYGLLNRLDNDTGWFLYFAKDKESFSFYKDQQKKWAIQKVYLAEVQGNPFFWSENTIKEIDTPIMHHRFDEKKMIVIHHEKDKKNGRGIQHMVSTKIQFLQYNKERNTSLLYVYITRWVRHQIRIHCKSIGSPIVGDKIYGPKQVASDFLRLRSIGVVQE